MQSGVDAIGELLSNFWRELGVWLPRFIGALVVLLVGYGIARWVGSVVRKALKKAKLDERLHTGKGGNWIQRAVPSPANLLAQLVFWAIFLGSISISVSVLGIPVLVDFVRAIYGYIPNVIAALLIFLAAGAISAGVVTLVNNTMGDTPTGRLIGTMAPVIVMGIAIFMILNQLRIAPEIVTITYAALIGSAAFGSALAFGLGGKEVASRIWQDLYEKGRQSAPGAMQDFRQGTREAQRRAGDLREEMR